MNGIDEYSIFVSQHRWYQQLFDYLVVNGYGEKSFEIVDKGKALEICMSW